MSVVYRFFNAEDDLLYIGQSQRMLTRIREHELCTPWFDEVTQITVQTTSAEDLDSVEREAIRNERPRYNVVHNTGLGQTESSQLGHSAFEFVAEMRDAGRTYRHISHLIEASSKGRVRINNYELRRWYLAETKRRAVKVAA